MFVCQSNMLYKNIDIENGPIVADKSVVMKEHEVVSSS